jgi:hypothetical protein
LGVIYYRKEQPSHNQIKPAAIYLQRDEKCGLLLVFWRLIRSSIKLETTAMSCDCSLNRLSLAAQLLQVHTPKLVQWY